jgi:hypothetical protein
MTATLTTWARLDWFGNSFEYITHTGGVGRQNENQKLREGLGLGDQQAGKGNGVQEKGEHTLQSRNTRHQPIFFCCCFASNIKSWPVIKYCHSLAIIIITIRISHVVLSFSEFNAAFAKQMQSIYGTSPPSETILSVGVLGRELGLSFFLSAITKMI